ncbi:MAG: family 10 glycosylhydrolase [Candidatus Izemoplasmatales bacterium]
MKLLKKIFLLTLSIFTIAVAFVPLSGKINLVPLQRNGSDVTHFWSTEKVMIPDTYTEKTTEFRGVWVATVYNLNMPQHTSQTQYKSAFQDLISELLESNMNAMLFQVRPLNDAFYESDYAPWSRYLTGVEGQDPGWDVMAWMIEECHNNGIEFHAWMNPYRVANTTSTKEDYLKTLKDNNFAKMRPDLVVSGEVDSHNRNPLILNPGEPEVKTYIRNVVTEIMTKYDVDGIHFDDYFYPYSGISSDLDTYDTYKETDQSLDDWRRENVNDIVRGVKEDVDAYNLSSGNFVKFGISPFGLWGSGIEGYSQYLPGGSNTGPTNLSSYRGQYADSKKWVEQGWLHYISPQVYWNFTHSTAPYADVVDWWASIARGTGVDVYIGHAPSAADSGGWLTEEIGDQLRYNLKHPEIKGEIMYSASYLDKSHMQYVETNHWTVTPFNVYDATEADIQVDLAGESSGNIFLDDVTVTLTASDSIWYQLDDGDWQEYTEPFTVSGTGSHVIYMKTRNESGVESSIVSQNITIQYLNVDVPSISITGNTIDDDYVVGSVMNITSESEDIYVKMNFGSVGEYSLYTEPIVLDEAGRYYFYVKTIDDRGIESEVVEMGVTVVEECYANPSINVEGIGNDPDYQSATIRLSGETSLQYKINDGDWLDYTEPFTLNNEGEYIVYYRNNDACLNVFEKEITIDQTPPAEPSITIDGSYDGERYYTSETNISLHTSEPDTSIFYRLHNGSSWTSWSEYDEPIVLLASSTYTLEYKALDKALNESETISKRIRLLIPPSETNPFVIRDGEVVTYYNTDIAIPLPVDYIEKEEEIRAIWVATVSNIDIGLYESEEQYKAEIIKMLNTIENNNFNVIFFQVRPMNDAFYDSDYAPWSRYLSGTEGQDPGWDVLSFMIEESHKRGIEFHAWLNPYRVSTDTGSKESQLAGLDDENFAKQNPDLVIQDNAGKLILNPGERRVQIYIRSVIQELINNYNVDGIHFDDYFYSYNGTPEDADNDLYERLKEPEQSLDDWRRENINTVIKEAYELIETYNNDFSETVKFGVSPFGIWSSGGQDGSNTSPYTMQSYSDQYADTKHWVEMGWLHYILPQLYWQFDHNSAPFADLVDWWADLAQENNVDLIIGHGFYRYDDDTWDDTNELPEQLRYISQYDIIKGSAFFSYRVLNSLDKEVVEFMDRLNDYYWQEYAGFTWDSDVEKTACGVGEEYRNGECYSLCSAGEEYVDGECVSVCSVGEEYVDGDCVSVCPAGEEYIDGECESICGQDQYYEDGQCLYNPCPDGYERIDGECESICGQDQYYEDGQCLYNACPDGYERIEGECELIEPDNTGCGWFNMVTFSFMGLFSMVVFGTFRKWF